MSRPLVSRRERALQLVRRQLGRSSSPYLLLLLVLTATGLSGFLASVLLRYAGLNSMALRYPVCVALAYLVFLFQLFLYVLYHRRRMPSPSQTSSSTAEAAELALEVAEERVEASPLLPFSLAQSNAEGKPGLDLLKGEGEGASSDDVGAILVLIVLVVLVLVAVVTSFMVLVEAPILLAELLVDGVLMAGMARRVRSANPRDWVFSVIRRTWFPAGLVAMVFALGGFLLESLTPGATTMLEALQLRH